MVPLLGEGVPLLALALKAIYVECHRHAKDARHPRVDCVSAIAIESNIDVVGQQVKRREARMRKCVEVLVPYGGQVLPLHAAIVTSGFNLAAIDHNLMSPLN